MGLLAWFKRRRALTPAAPPVFAISVIVRRFPGLTKARTSGLGPAVLLQHDGIAAEQTIATLRNALPRCWIDLIGTPVAEIVQPYHPSALLANGVVSFEQLDVTPILEINNLGGFGQHQTRPGYDLILLEHAPSEWRLAKLRRDLLNEGGVLAINDTTLYQATTPNTAHARK